MDIVAIYGECARTPTTGEALAELKKRYQESLNGRVSAQAFAKFKAQTGGASAVADMAQQANLPDAFNAPMSELEIALAKLKAPAWHDAIADALARLSSPNVTLQNVLDEYRHYLDFRDDLQRIIDTLPNGDDLGTADEARLAAEAEYELAKKGVEDLASNPASPNFAVAVERLRKAGLALFDWCSECRDLLMDYTSTLDGIRLMQVRTAQDDAIVQRTTASVYKGLASELRQENNGLSMALVVAATAQGAQAQQVGVDKEPDKVPRLVTKKRVVQLLAPHCPTIVKTLEERSRDLELDRVSITEGRNVRWDYEALVVVLRDRGKLEGTPPPVDHIGQDECAPVSIQNLYLLKAHSR